MNAIVIEQTQDEAKLAFEVHQNADISRIRLAHAKLASQAIDTAPKTQIEVVFNFKSKPMIAPPDVLRLEIAFRMAGIEEKEAGEEDAPEKTSDNKKAEPVILVECAYEADYVLREGFEITSEHVKAFKDGNAIFNAWPYFREYLQSNLQRMGLPPLTAPFLRLQPKPKPRKREKNEHETERSLPGQ
jgi:hypothetical protein